jgi:hypothetical protein
MLSLEGSALSQRKRKRSSPTTPVTTSTANPSTVTSSKNLTRPRAAELIKTHPSFIGTTDSDITLSPTTGKVATSKLKPGLMDAPAPGTFGNFPVNSLNGPNYFNFDLSVTKRIPIAERVRFELKVTAINILNHPNFVFGNQNFDSTTFGLVTTQRGTARNINFIGQLSF